MFPTPRFAGSHAPTIASPQSGPWLIDLEDLDA